MNSLTFLAVCVSSGRDIWCSADLLGSLRKEDADSHLAVLDALGLLGALDEGNIDDVLARGDRADKVLGVRVPSNGEGVLPAAKDGVAGLGLEECLTAAAPVAGCRDVANSVSVVGRHAAGPQGEPQLLEGVGVGVEVLRLRPLDPAELGREVGAAVEERVALLKGNVAAPVADLNVALELRHVNNGLGELEADGGRGRGTRGLLAKGSVSQLGALLLGELLAAISDLGVVGNVGRRGLDLRLLLGGGVGRRDVDGEIVNEELGLVLGNRRGEGRVGLEDVVGDAQGQLATGLEGGRQADAVVLNVAVVGYVVSNSQTRGASTRALSPQRINFDDLGNKEAGLSVLAISDLETADTRQLVRGEWHVVLVLRGFVDVLDQDIDLLLDKVLLQGDDVDEVGILEHLRRLEGGRQVAVGLGGVGAGACDDGGEQAQEAGGDGGGSHCRWKPTGKCVGSAAPSSVSCGRWDEGRGVAIGTSTPLLVGDLARRSGSCVAGRDSEASWQL